MTIIKVQIIIQVQFFFYKQLTLRDIQGIVHANIKCNQLLYMDSLSMAMMKLLPATCTSNSLKMVEH